jgi:hypothetical protein
VSRRPNFSAGILVVLVIACGVALAGWRRWAETREYSRPHSVKTVDGTNYVVRLMETTVGRTDRGAAVIVTVWMENPNPFNVALDRRKFLLVDQEKKSYEPSTMGTQTPSINLPAQGFAEKEMLSYSVPEKVFAGALDLQIGHDNLVQLKSDKPFQQNLPVGEFRSFRRRQW